MKLRKVYPPLTDPEKREALRLYDMGLGTGCIGIIMKLGIGPLTKLFKENRPPRSTKETIPASIKVKDCLNR